MNKYVKLALTLILFVGFMAGVYVLYQKLAGDYKPQQNLVENTADGTISEESASTPSKEDDTTPPASEESAEDAQKSMAMDFAMTNKAGEEVRLLDFKGKPIILNFWASWCGPCKMEMPDFNEAYSTYKDEIEFLMVNMTDGSRETVEKASSFIAESGYTFPVYYDTEYSAAITYSVSSLPTTYFLNAEGELVTYAKGAINAAILEKGISMIFAK